MQMAQQHQCLIYEGAPSRQLPALAAQARQKLNENYRCIYLNSPPMVAGMRSYLAAAGVDVMHEVAKSSLFLTSELQAHPSNGGFDIDRMMEMLENALDQALGDGYMGLWATGDMTWEFGAEKDFSKLLEYEWRLEEWIRQCPAFCGICQYHRDTLPAELMRHGVATHPSLFVNETLSRINPHYVQVGQRMGPLPENLIPDSVITELCQKLPVN